MEKKPDKELYLLDLSHNKDAVSAWEAQMKEKQIKRERYNFTLGLVTGTFISLFVILFLYGGNPNPTVHIETFSSLVDDFQQSQQVEVIEVSRVEIVQWKDTEETEDVGMREDGGVEFKPGYHTSGPACSVQESDRFDCWPEFWFATQKECEMRGCCWKQSPTSGVPFCFYPYNYVSYAATSSSSSASGMTASLTRQAASPFPKDAMELQVDVIFQSENIARFRITDPATKRFEVPMDLNLGTNSTPADQTDYKVTFQESPFGIQITRRSTGMILFDSRNMAPLVYADQYLQMSTRLSTPNIYGLGEHQGPLLLNTNWNKLVIWARDEGPDGGGNLYGAHPFYLNLEPDGKAHGVFLFSSNAMEVVLQPYAEGEGAITYRVLGGILDFFIFTGPSPLQVVEQYVSLIGRPVMPPFWSLGFHLCKYGYGSSKVLSEVIERNRAAKIPYDVQWNDIDYMDAYKDWTYDSNGSYTGLKEIVDDLHAHNQRYIMIIDPGISSVQAPGTYPPYDQGLQMDVFVKNATGQVLIGQVWPGQTAFPDFFHPNVDQYWYNQMKSYHDMIPYDGIWLDMNEVSNFIAGSTHGCTNSSLDRPPYVPPTINGKSLYAKTMCPSAKQAVSENYNLHNMYGWSEMRSTRAGLTKLFGKRSFILSRSTFSGSGQFGAHWTGDIRSEWSDLYYSIPSILKSNMFGISMVGADICGFGEDTSRELCIRWMQLGAFYPFMRNHDSLGNKPQDPASFDPQAQDYMRKALELRYSLLPFMYTCFYLSHTTGTPVIRPLFMLFPNTANIDKQFMWGDSLLISPVLKENATKVDAYFPAGLWYDVNTGKLLDTVPQETLVLDAPLDTINVHVRGGSIIPALPPAVTTNEMRGSPFVLLVAPDEQSTSQGLLYWDDGESVDTVKNNNYTLVNFTMKGTMVQSHVVSANYPGMKLDTVMVLGVPSEPKSVTLNGGTAAKFSYNTDIKVLFATELSVDLLQPFHLQWTF